MTATLDKVIPAPDNRERVYKENGNTPDIMVEVLETISESAGQLKNLAPYLKAARLEDTCRAVWNLVKNNIAYKIDPKGYQWVQTPARLWSTKVGDCKSYSVFIATALWNLGIKSTIRFVSFSTSPVPTHVYVVVKNNGREIILDAVLDKFNKEKPFTHKYDYNMTRISRLSGIGSTAAQPITIDDLTLKIIRERMELEKAMLEGIGNSGAFYDQSINQLDQLIRQAGQGPQISGFLKNVGNFLKKAVNTVVDVVTFPVTLAAKGVLEVALPAAGISFLYLFITKPDIIAKLPAAVKRKRENQLKLKNFIIGAVNMKDEHFMGIVRNGIMKRVGTSPEAYLSSQLKTAISGIGSPVDGGTLTLAAQSGQNAQASASAFLSGIVELIKKIASIFGKKSPVSGEEAAPSPDDWTGWLDSLSQPVATVIDNLKKEEPSTAYDNAVLNPTYTGNYTNNNDPGGGPEKKPSNMPLYIGGAALLFFLLKK